jgi:hypothetical protein
MTLDLAGVLADVRVGSEQLWEGRRNVQYRNAFFAAAAAIAFVAGALVSVRRQCESYESVTGCRNISLIRLELL